MSYTEQDLYDIAEGVLRTNRFLTLATSSRDGKPWVAPLMYAVDKANGFYWTSALEAIHSQHIRENPAVAIVIFNSDPQPGKAQALYGIAAGQELAGPDLQFGCDVFYRMRYPDDTERAAKGRTPRDFEGDSPRRMYRATVSEYSILHPAKSHPVYGSLVDYRVAIRFDTKNVGVL